MNVLSLTIIVIVIIISNNSNNNFFVFASCDNVVTSDAVAEFKD